MSVDNIKKDAANLLELIEQAEFYYSDDEIEAILKLIKARTRAAILIAQEIADLEGRGMPRNDGSVQMDGVRIIFRNFKGAEGKYNKEGERNFSVLLSPEFAEAMAADGWNVKMLKPREDIEEETEEQPFLPVALRYDIFPPRVVLVTSKKRRVLEERELEILDNSEILNVDLIVRPRHYDVNGKTGIKAYVKTMYVTIEEDPLDEKYADIPMS